jgi:hypothetical protein
MLSSSSSSSYHDKKTNSITSTSNKNHEFQLFLKQNKLHTFTSYSRLRYSKSAKAISQDLKSNNEESKYSHRQQRIGLEGEMTFVEFNEFDAWFQACKQSGHQSQKTTV